MRILYHLLTMISVGLTLISCSSETNKPTLTQSILPHSYTSNKNPLTVTLYTKNKLKPTYKIIGKSTISKFNLGGNKRQKANIRNNLRELAAAMGGDAIIDIKHDANSITGTVIAYQKPEQANPVNS